MKHSKVNSGIPMFDAKIPDWLAHIPARPRIMGILNITPDSFSDGGQYFPKGAVERAQQMIAEGADIIDIGAESSRPGAIPVSSDEQMQRLHTILEPLSELSVDVSVDTRSTQVMKAVLPYGVSMINDISALSDEGAMDVIAASKADICLMHMQGNPQIMQKAPHYENIVAEIYDYLARRIEACEVHGIARDRILIDPGFGFGKTLSHNIQLLTQLSIFKKLGCRLMVGLSRKSMLMSITGKTVHEQAASGLTAALLSLLQGADVIRTHDVAATRDALSVLAALKEEVFA